MASGGLRPSQNTATASRVSRSFSEDRSGICSFLCVDLLAVDILKGVALESDSVVLSLQGSEFSRLRDLVMPGSLHETALVRGTSMRNRRF